MSNDIFPTMPGMTPEVTRTAIWSTTNKTSVNQREYRTANMSYPRYKVKLNFEVLRQSFGLAEMTILAGFINQRFGGFDSFLWTDPDDNTVNLQTIGVGDGVNKTFQLVRNFGGFVEPVYDTNATPMIYVAGVIKSFGGDYSVSSTGVVSLTAAPALGSVVAWTGTFYRRMCFVSDRIEFSQFLPKLWSLKALELISVKP